MTDKTVSIFSKLTADNIYTKHVPGAADLPREVHRVMINGGTGVANKNLITPDGVCTMVSEEDLTMLLENEVFKLHKKNGFIKIYKGKLDVEIAVQDMEAKDTGSAPLTPDDFKNSEVEITTAKDGKKTSSKSDKK